MAIIAERFQKWRPEQPRDFHGRWVDEIAGGEPEKRESELPISNFRAHLHAAVKTKVHQYDHNPFYRHQWIHVSGGTAVVQNTDGMNVTVRHVDTQRLETFHINTKEIHRKPMPPQEWRDRNAIGLDGTKFGPKALPPNMPSALETFHELIEVAHAPGMNPFGSIAQAAEHTHPRQDVNKVGRDGRKLVFRTTRDAARIGITAVRVRPGKHPAFRFKAS